jgi:hypothetical protein
LSRAPLQRRRRPWFCQPFSCPRIVIAGRRTSDPARTEQGIPEERHHPTFPQIAIDLGPIIALFDSPARHVALGHTLAPNLVSIPTAVCSLLSSPWGCIEPAPSGGEARSLPVLGQQRPRGGERGIFLSALLAVGYAALFRISQPRSVHRASACRSGRAAQRHLKAVAGK